MRPAAVMLLCAAWAAGQRPGPVELPRETGARDKQVALGARLAAEVERNATVIHDPSLEAYLERLAGKAAASCAAGLTVRIRVIEAESVDGFTLPGGFLFVHTGLIRRAESEAELAGVLAYLVALSDAGGLAQPVRLQNYSSIPLMFMGGWDGSSYGPKSNAGLAVPMSFQERYRAAVEAADARGLECLRAAGYDPDAYLDGLRKLPEGRGLTHPLTTDRIEKARRALERQGPATGALVSTSDFDEAKRRIRSPAPRTPSLWR